MNDFNNIDVNSLNSEQKLELLKLLDAKIARQEEVLLNSKYSLIQEAALCSKAKIVIVVGGNQSGKSHTGATRVAICATGIIPDSLKDKFPEQLVRHGDYWCSALDYGGARDIIRNKLDKILPNRVIDRYSKDDKIYYLKDNMGQIGLKSEESRRGKYQGVQRLGVWMDEEHTKPVYDEIFERVTTLKGFIFFTFSPIEGLTWSYNELYIKAKRIYYTKNKHGISEEVGAVHSLEEIAKMKDRQLIIQENQGDHLDPNIEVYIISKYDNEHMPDEEIQNSERKYVNDPAAYQARVLGRYSRLSNKNVFDKTVLMKMQSKVSTKFIRGSIVNGQFKENVGGNLTIFDKDLKKPTGCYVIGADIAAGDETGDYSCAQVINRRTCEQVAVWHGHCSPEEFASILYNMGTFFNNAYIAPERNFHGYGVVNALREKKYLRLYYDKDRGQRAIKNSVSGNKLYGWLTDARTKPIMIQTLASYLRDGRIRINDVYTVDELLTYVYDQDGHTNAMGGCFDDRVIALAIALQVYENTPITTLRAQEDNHPDPKINNKITGY